MGQIESSSLRKTLEKERDKTEEDGPSILNLQGIYIGETDARQVAKLLKQHHNTQLQMIQLGACSLSSESLEHLARSLCSTTSSSTITRIDLSTSGNPPDGNPIGNDGAKSISMFIKQCSNLRHLRAAGCNLECVAMVTISEALAITDSLQTLDLSNNLISNEGAKQLGIALATNNSLQGLSLWKNLITGEGIELFVVGLSQNSSIKWLGLGCNAIGDHGVQVLTDALVENIANCQLNWLALGNNNISDEGAEKLAEFLTAGWTNIDEDEGEEGVACPLTSLGLGGNIIANKGAKELAQSLDVNNKLTSLGLSYNKIGDDGAKCFADMLRNNTTLEKLSLSGNNIGNEGGETLIASLSQNNSLSTLILSQNPLGEAVIIRCTEVFTRYNSTLQVLDLCDTQISTAALHKFRADLKATQSKIRLPSLGDQILTISEKDVRSSVRISDNLLDVASWRPPPSSVVPYRGLFEVSERTRNIFSLPTFEQPPQNKSKLIKTVSQYEEDEEECDSGPSQTSSSSSLELDIPMFSGGLVDEGEGEGEIAELTDEKSNVVLMHSEVAHSRASAWRNSRLVEESLELEPTDMGGSGDDDKEHTYGDISLLSTVSEMTLVDEVDPMQDETLTSQTIEMETHTVQPTESKTESSTTKPETHTTKSETHVMKPGTDVLKSEMHTTCHTTNAETCATNSKTHISTGNTKKSPVTSENTSISNKRSHSKGVKKPWRNELGTPIKLPVQNNHVADIDLQDQGTLQEPQVTKKEPYSKSQRKPKKLENTSQISLTTRDDGKKVSVDSKFQLKTMKDTSLISEVTTYAVPSQLKITLEIENEEVFYETVKSKDVVQDYRESVLQEVERDSLLYSLTKERPKPPPGRRHPSINKSTLSTKQKQEKRTQEEEDQPFYVNVDVVPDPSIKESNSDDEEGANKPAGNEPKLISLSGDNYDNRDTRPIKEQWISCLRKRIDILKMGGFINKGYDNVTSYAKTIEYNNFMAGLACNNDKNKEGGILAPSHTRVKLQRVMEDLGSDYINANFIGSPSYPKSYIIAQWPMEKTIPDFWRMIWELRVGVVVIIGNDDKPFWPEKGDDYQLHPVVIMGQWFVDSLYVKVEKESPTNVEGMMEIAMIIHSYDDDITERMTMFHYPYWPQNGVPQSAQHIAFLFHRSLAARLSTPTSGPLVVVSSHGGGRAGCYSAVSVVYELLQTPSSNPDPFDQDPYLLDSVFRGLLSQRPGLVATQRQYDFCHRILEECLWGPAARGEEDIDGQGRGAKFLNMFKKKKKTIS